ncbi:hypothetical protein ATANTOWER_022001 [Ataeniobius toweri]|uniref:Cadherin domain-containing protein n=1 Tax=Ataeniobius toweri TaxID=208326 RepID=A0ABU7BB44_9TELE|nr:hypothetical protein [Ataeniobius toweri]
MIPENNTADIQVVKITSNSDVTLSVSVNPEDLFYMKGNILMVKKGLDYESLSSPTLLVWVKCSKAGSRSVNESVEVLVENVNDNPPNFAQNHYVLDVNELTPVNLSVGLIEATDVDSEPLYYRLESATPLVEDVLAFWIVATTSGRRPLANKLDLSAAWLRGTPSRWDSRFCVLLRWLLVEPDLPGRSVFLLLDIAGISCGPSIVCFRKCAANHHGVRPI